MELVSHPSKQNIKLLGDFYFGYLIPTVICGRTHSFKRDISSFISNWCNEIFEEDINKTVINYPDFGLESLGTSFRDHMFSKILVLSPKENLLDAWQILWGVWSEVFKNPPEENSADYVLLFRVSCIFLMLYLYFSQSGLHNLPIPISLDTFKESLELSHVILKRFKITSVFNVLNYMVNHKCFSFSSYDGVQYLYQDKFGRPLKVNRSRRMRK